MSSPEKPIRVLIVDDSAFARKVLREVLRGVADIEVLDIARDGLEALEKIAALKPDVVTLDLAMPELDGMGVLKALPAVGGPRVVIVTCAAAASERAVTALQAGAFDIVEKPTALATDRLYEMSDELISKVRAAGGIRVEHTPAAPARRMLATPTSATRRTRILVIGTSTGGPQALTRLLPLFPADFPMPIAIALHIPFGYTEALARRLDDASALNVVEASEDLVLRPGLAIIAPGGSSLELERAGDTVRARIRRRLPRALYAPSVDMLFNSAVAVYGADVMGVVLTGMGDDGLIGAGTIRAAGGQVIAESESSCIVDGMPRCVREAGLASAEAPLNSIVETLLHRL